MTLAVGGPAPIARDLADLDDGTYETEFALTDAGSYTVNATVNSSRRRLALDARCHGHDHLATSSIVSGLDGGNNSELGSWVFHDPGSRSRNLNVDGAVGAAFSARMDGTVVTIGGGSAGLYTAIR